MENAVLRELVRLFVNVHKPVSSIFFATTDIFGRGGFQPSFLAEDVVSQLWEGIIKHQDVERQLAEIHLTKYRMMNECGGQDISLNVQGRAVMNRCTHTFSQSVKTYQRPLLMHSA